MIQDILNAFKSSIRNDVGSVGEILSMLIAVAIMSSYELLVYRIVSHRTLFNKSFNISITILPFFIGAIIMALQSDIVITLGTIGALAIIRYRTAIKDPVEMIYILWSVFVGITCGCKLYELCLLTSLIVTIMLIIINLLNKKIFRKTFVLVINSEKDIETEVNSIIDKSSKSYKLKSRNYTSSGIDYVYEIECKDSKEIIENIKKISGIKQFSLVEYDLEDVI